MKKKSAKTECSYNLKVIYILIYYTISRNSDIRDKQIITDPSFKSQNLGDLTCPRPAKIQIHSGCPL